MNIIQIIVILFFPMFIIYISKKISFLKILGPVVLCYIAGIGIANLPFINFNSELSMSISEVAVPIAIPMILYQTDIIGFIKSTKSTIVSFILVIVSALISSVSIALLFKDIVPDYWKIGGMLVGCYTGGTPNLMAIGMGLGISSDTLVLVNAADIAAGGIYFIFVITIAKPLFSKILPQYKHVEKEEVEEIKESKYNIKGVIVALFISILIASSGIGISYILTKGLEIWIIILTITTFSIIMSLFKSIRSINGTYEFGQYILLIFSFAIGLTVNISDFINSSTSIFPFVMLVVTVAVLIHLLLAYIFKIDVDTMIITSTAGIFGPIFVGSVAKSIKNREVIIAGITSGLIGYAIGNYLGLLTSILIKSI